MALVNGDGANGSLPNGWQEPAAALPLGGAFSRQARAQYAALAALRWQMFTNGMRSGKGAFELGARIFSLCIYGFLGLAIGGGAGVAAYAAVAGREWRFLPVLFWILFFVWQMIPIMLASFQEQFDLGILLRFPVRFGSYLLLYVVFGLADISTILGGLCCCGIWFGMVAARPELVLWTTLSLVVFAAFNVLLARAILAWIDRWLAQRKTREILGAIFMVAVLGMQLMNPALYQNRHRGHSDTLSQARDYRDAKAQWQAKYQPMLHTANQIQRWLRSACWGSTCWVRAACWRLG